MNKIKEHFTNNKKEYVCGFEKILYVLCSIHFGDFVFCGKKDFR